MFPLFAAAAGAAAMYFFDPEQGNRRRALARDKVAWFKDEIGDMRETAAGRAEDLRNRTKGMIHEVKKSASTRTDGMTSTDRTTEPAHSSGSAPASADYGTDTIQKAA
jgi:gas vesicle protein